MHATEARQSREIGRLDERVDVLEGAWAETLHEIHRWRTWLTLSVFTLAITSLILSGVYLGGVLF